MLGFNENRMLENRKTIGNYFADWGTYLKGRFAQVLGESGPELVRDTTYAANDFYVFPKCLKEVYSHLLAEYSSQASPVLDFSSNEASLLSVGKILLSGASAAVALDTARKMLKWYDSRHKSTGPEND